MKTKTKLLITVAVASAAMATVFYIYKKKKSVKKPEESKNASNITTALKHFDELEKQFKGNTDTKPSQPEIVDKTAVKWDLVDKMRANHEDIDWDDPKLYYSGSEYIDEDEYDERGNYTRPEEYTSTNRSRGNADGRAYSPDSDSGSNYNSSDTSFIVGEEGKDYVVHSRDHILRTSTETIEAQQDNGKGSKGSNSIDGVWEMQKIGQEGIMRYDEDEHSKWSSYKRSRLEDIPMSSGTYMTLEDLFYRKFISHREEDDNVIDSCLEAREDFFGEGSPYLEEISWAEVLLFFAQLSDHDLNRGVYYWVSIFLDNINLSPASESFTIDNTLVELSDGEYVNTNANTQGLFGFDLDDDTPDELDSFFDEYDYFVNKTQLDIADEKSYMDYDDDDINWNDPDDGIDDDIGYSGMEDD